MGSNPDSLQAYLVIIRMFSLWKFGQFKLLLKTCLFCLSQRHTC